MKNPYLLKNMTVSKIIQSQLQPGGEPGATIDRLRICGFPSVMEELSRDLATEIISAIGDVRNMAKPDVIAARSFKSALFSQWVMKSLADKGCEVPSFRWFSKRITHIERIEPSMLGIRNGTNVLICSIDLHSESARKIASFAALFCRSGGRVIATVSAFNSQNVTAQQMGVQHVISLYDKGDLMRALGLTPEPVT